MERWRLWVISINKEILKFIQSYLWKSSLTTHTSIHISRLQYCWYTVADWDSMSRVITQTRSRAFQTLGWAFNFLLNPQKLGLVFQKLGRMFWNNCSDESFNQLTHFHNLVCKKAAFIQLITALNSFQSFRYLLSIVKFSIQFKSLSLFSLLAFFSFSDTFSDTS